MTGAETLTLAQLEHLAAELWTELPSGAVLWLSGQVGGGKTTFAQAVLRAGAGEHARSPTYALVNHYTCPSGIVVHVDCYRLQHPSEAIDLDFQELLRHARLLLVEWPERAGEHAPEPWAHLHFAHADQPHVRLVERIK